MSNYQMEQCPTNQLDLHRGGAVETSARSRPSGAVPDAARAAETAVAAATAIADTTATGAATPGAEVATDAFPDGTGAPWHALQRHVPC